MRFWLMAGLLVLSLVAGTPVRADDAGWNALRLPGTAAIMRHATAPGTGDPDHFTLDDCTTQRNLSEEGRAQARAIGAAIRRNGIAVTRVLSSQWCRCRDTAQLLGVGPVEPLPALNSFFRNPGAGERQTQALRAFLARHAADEKLILVTHQVNITALTGIHPASGEIIVVGITPDGNAEVRGRIAP